jgi:hypothetical protein
VIIILHLESLVNICAEISQYRGKEYPCANIDMQNRLISLVQSGVPDGKSEATRADKNFEKRVSTHKRRPRLWAIHAD